MKYIATTTLIALLWASATVYAQSSYSKPFGYVTHTLKAGQFNLIGLTLHKPVIISGAFEKVAATTLTDNDVDFGDRLKAGKTYILEITDAAEASLNGTIQEITIWSQKTITTPQDLGSVGLKAGDKYQLRAAKTLADVFGPKNRAGLAATANYAIGEADVIYVPNGDGFDRFFYSTADGKSRWVRDDFTQAGHIPISYTDAIFVFRRGNTDLDLIVHGNVKLTVTALALKGGDFNYVSTIFPVGATLGNSGLGSSLKASENINTADIVYMLNGSGKYKSYFYTRAEGVGKWYDADLNDASGVPMQSGIVIQRRAAARKSTLTPPASYSDL